MSKGIHESVPFQRDLLMWGAKIAWYTSRADFLQWKSG